MRAEIETQVLMVVIRCRPPTPEERVALYDIGVLAINGPYGDGAVRLTCPEDRGWLEPVRAIMDVAVDEDEVFRI